MNTNIEMPMTASKLHGFLSRFAWDALILVPVVTILLVGFWQIDRWLVGAGSDFVRRWLVLYFATWFVAWLVTAGVLVVVETRHGEFSLSIRCLLTTVVCWPLLGVCTCGAEEWTVAHRMATWVTPQDTGFHYMYANMSGMGYARGWFDLGRRLIEFSLLGVVSSVVWLPVLVLACGFLYMVRRALHAVAEPEPLRDVVAEWGLRGPANGPEGGSER